MLIFVGKKENVDYDLNRLTEKLTEDLTNFSSKDLWNGMNDEVLVNESIRFHAYKELFMNAKQNLIISTSYWNYLGISDSFYVSYLKKLAKAVGCINVIVSDIPYNDNDIIFFNPDKDFYIDLVAKVKPIVERISKDPLNQIVNSIDGLGYYLGSTDSQNMPTKIIHLGEYSSGQKISFDEYLEWHLKTFKNFKTKNFLEALNETENYAFVRSRHSVELMCKAIERRKA